MYKNKNTAKKEGRKERSKKEKSFMLPRKNYNKAKEPIIKILARDLLYEVPKYDTRFVLVRTLLEGIVQENPKLDKEQVRQSLYDVKNKGYVREKIIKSTEDGMIIKFELTKKGKELLRGYEFYNLKTEHPKKWDGKWRFIIFDIPEKSRYARDIFRDKLKNLGFFMLQQSVWVYPYECKKEIDFILEFLGLRSYVLYFEVEIERDAWLRKYFRKNF